MFTAELNAYGPVMTATLLAAVYWLLTWQPRRLLAPGRPPRLVRLTRKAKNQVATLDNATLAQEHSRAWLAITRYPQLARLPVLRKVAQRALPDVGLLVTEVATLIRSGASPATAWDQALGNSAFSQFWYTGHTSLGLNTNSDETRQPGQPPLPGTTGTSPDPHSSAQLLAWQRFAETKAGRACLGPGGQAGMHAALAATKLSTQLGAPLATVLDHCAQGITEAGEAAAARQLALTGPRSSARLLTLLPLGGMGLGAALGVNPVHSLSQGGLSTVSCLAGLALLIAGHLWVRKLIHAADTAGV